MKNMEELTILKAPYFHLAVSEKPNFQRFHSIYKSVENINLTLKIIEGNNCTTLDRLFGEFAKAFEFPDYFGYNWAAFDECLNDLEWLSADAYLLLLTDVDKVIAALNSSLKTFIEILFCSVTEWTEGRNYDGFPTPPTPFHVVFQCSKGNINEVLSMLEIVGLQSINVLDIPE